METTIQNGEKTIFNSFITQEMFLNLASCILIVSGAVEVFKPFFGGSPLILNLIFSCVVTIVRIILISDYSVKGIIIGIFNLIPILLGATGCFEIIKNITRTILN